jgi:hypothetical protein
MFKVMLSGAQGAGRRAQGAARRRELDVGDGRLALRAVTSTRSLPTSTLPRSIDHEEARA